MVDHIFLVGVDIEILSGFVVLLLSISLYIDEEIKKIDLEKLSKKYDYKIIALIAIVVIMIFGFILMIMSDIISVLQFK